MREILFRGKRVENCEWVEGSLYQEKKPFTKSSEIEETIIVEHRPDLCLVSGAPDNNHWWRRVIPETVGQFTGITDKNGVKVFEGDIVLHEDYSNGACITFEQFKSKSQVVIDDLMHGCSSFTGLPSHCIRSNEIEVVGNIHDNPELLK